MHLVWSYQTGRLLFGNGFLKLWKGTGHVMDSPSTTQFAKKHDYCGKHQEFINSIKREKGSNNIFRSIRPKWKVDSGHKSRQDILNFKTEFNVIHLYYVPGQNRIIYHTWTSAGFLSFMPNLLVAYELLPYPAFRTETDITTDSNK